jgi:hypothetical protein
MKATLIDASSAILLFKAGLFETMASAFNVAVAPAAFQEITVTGHDGADGFKESLARRQIKMATFRPPPETEPALAALGAGERETIIAFQQGAADFVIMDDRKGALFCRERRIPYINALLCPSVLLGAGYVDHAMHSAAFARLLHLGHYSRAVIAFARGCAQEDLACFLPVRKHSHPGEGIFD